MTPPIHPPMKITFLYKCYEKLALAPLRLFYNKFITPKSISNLQGRRKGGVNFFSCYGLWQVGQYYSFEMSFIASKPEDFFLCKKYKSNWDDYCFGYLKEGGLALPWHSHILRVLGRWVHSVASMWLGLHIKLIRSWSVLWGEEQLPWNRSHIPCPRYSLDIHPLPSQARQEI